MMLLVLLQIGGQKTNLLVSFSFICLQLLSKKSIVLQVTERTLCNIALFVCKQSQHRIMTGLTEL